ncbi:hypothetical protein Pst134EB_029919 [Puccinia striiformis f. sp. tritici]|nr:hypothetical protein Pst134EB_029919 [Puccinia striiformis f. sp. tritici]
MNIFSCYLVFGLLAWSAVAPSLPPDDAPLYSEVSRRIAGHLAPASERVQSGPLEGGTPPARGRPADGLYFIMISERPHGANPVHTDRGTDASSALDLRQSQSRDLQAGMRERSTPTVPRNRLVRSFRSMVRHIPRLSWHRARRTDPEPGADSREATQGTNLDPNADIRTDIEGQAPHEFHESSDTLTTPTGERLGPLTERILLLQLYNLLSPIIPGETLSAPSHWEHFPTHWEHIPNQIGIMDNNSNLLTIDPMLLAGLYERMLATPAGGESHHTNPEHNLKEGDQIPNTMTLRYMPRPPGYQSKTSGANGMETISLDQAIGLLEATSTNVPESDPTDVNRIIKEQKADTNGEKTEDDHITSQKSIHDDAEGSTRPTSSLQDISEVLLGDPLETPCAICGQESSQPQKNDQNEWVFEQITMIDHCQHHFHTPCLETWIITNKENTCPICRHHIIPAPPSEP